MQKEFESIVLGAGIYGLYAARLLSKAGRTVCVLEYDSFPMQRATLVNQARVHYGYHYPRSLSTAIKSAQYFNRFNDDFHFAINRQFKKIYAVAKNYSYTSGEQFMKFCERAQIPCEEIIGLKYFNNSFIETAFETKEYAFDAKKIKDYFMDTLSRYKNVSIYYNTKLDKAEKSGQNYSLITESGQVFSAPYVLNATYASANQVIKKFGFDLFKLKYEICEVILCTVSDNIKNVGLTVMDGPFFSLMPFGLSGLHSITSVTFTPHATSYEQLPTFKCQKCNPKCTPNQLENCNTCPVQPKTAWIYMAQLAKKFLAPSITMHFYKTLFAIKPIFLSSEVDDSRPTVIKIYSKNPTFVSILSGKINTIYDLNEVLL